MPWGRKAGVVPGTHPPSPPLSALSGSPTVKMEPKPGNPGWPSWPSSLRAPPVVSEKNSEWWTTVRAEGFSSMARTHLSAARLVGMTKLR